MEILRVVKTLGNLMYLRIHIKPGKAHDGHKWSFPTLRYACPVCRLFWKTLNKTPLAVSAPGFFHFLLSFSGTFIFAIYRSIRCSTLADSLVSRLFASHAPADNGNRTYGGKGTENGALLLTLTRPLN